MFDSLSMALCPRCGGQGCKQCDQKGTATAYVELQKKIRDRNQQTLKIRTGQIWIPKGGRSNARWEVTELHHSTLNVAEPDLIVEVVLHRVDGHHAGNFWKENMKYISPDDLLKRYIPEDPLPDVDLKISPDRPGITGVNPCICCGKELKVGSHSFICLDEAMGQVIDARFAPENNGGLHAIGHDCAKKYGYECYLVK